ncbi:hypothetical protein U9261_15360 [Escherichia coli]|uniref:hypothetical protein n=1 Tax=Escherichia coli TaxID=562 RepID=UPI001F61EE6A|nr:hypothetical protein [Escherichia coli]MCI3695429.1 hypothetical protein [Escherichia coli]
MQDKETQYQTEEKGIYCSYVCLGAARKAFVRSGCENKAKATAWSVLSSIASAARKQNDGSYVSEVCQAKIADETEWKAKRKKLTHCKADGFYRVYRPDRKQQQSSV